jgi:hypothetical protein
MDHKDGKRMVGLICFIHLPMLGIETATSRKKDCRGTLTRFCSAVSNLSA